MYNPILKKEQSISPRAETLWKKSNECSYKSYQKYIKKKGKDKYVLTLIDLLYISNFKGGNATINEEEYIINQKLTKYSEILKLIHNEFKEVKLFELEKEQLGKFYRLIESICDLTENLETKIDGFSVSYLSALLNSYFPNLIPILDRRVLINSRLVEKEDIYQGQIKSIRKFYKLLIMRISI